MMSDANEFALRGVTISRAARLTPVRYILLLALVALSACGKQVADNLPQAPALPVDGAGYGPVLGPYRIQPGDILDIKLLQVNELNEEVTVRPDGHISTAVVTDETAFGRTVPELAAALQRDYGDVMKEPHLTVVVKSFAPDRIYVGGEVVQPGEYITVPPNLTLAQAISRAGGVKPSGSYDNVIVIRRGPNDTPEVYQSRYNDVMSGADPAADVRLANYDMVYVPKTGVAEAFLFFNQYFQQFVPINWGFNYSVTSSKGFIFN